MKFSVKNMNFSSKNRNFQPIFVNFSPKKSKKSHKKSKNNGKNEEKREFIVASFPVFRLRQPSSFPKQYRRCGEA